MHRTLSFLPQLLVEIIRCDFSKGKECLEPFSFFVSGVCLIVDISGFTRLSGEYCNMGKDGIDQLQLATNGYMGKLVEIIYSCGGEIIKFAGDAIICLFPGENQSVRRFRENSGNGNEEINHKVRVNPIIKTETFLRAIYCANQLREVKTDRLTVHLGLSCGEICFAVLGGFENRWECLISGPCIHQLSQCLDEAPSKSIVMTSICTQIIFSRFDCDCDSGGGDHRGACTICKAESELGSCELSLTELPSGNSLIKAVNFLNLVDMSSFAMQPPRVSDQNVLEVLNLFVPTPVAKLFSIGRGFEYLCEIREVTTMFMKWDSYDVNKVHTDLLSLQDCFYEALVILSKTGAFLRQFLVDDKGCVLIACWGMPHLSYLDNARRALSCAAQIRSKLTAMEMMCSFGITTGDVYCGTVGSSLRMEYAAIGSVVNMAARLMGKANGGILIDEATYQRLPPSVLSMLVAKDPMKVKGRDSLLTVYAYVSLDLLSARVKIVRDEVIPPEKREIIQNFLDRMTVKDENWISSSETATLEAGKSGKVGGWKLPSLSPSTGRSRKRYLIRSISGGSQDKSTCSDEGVISGNSSYSSAKSSNSLISNQQTQITTLPLQVLLIKGGAGSGKASLTNWLRKKASNRNIGTYSVKVTSLDTYIPFVVWNRLFHRIAPKDIFVRPDAQRAYVINLINKVYPSLSRSMIIHKFAVFKSALGVSCSYRRVEADKTGFLAQQEDEMETRVEKLPKVSSVSIIETLFDTFQYLLNLKPRLLIIESVDKSDEGSLSVLWRLMSICTRSGLVLTALQEHARSSNERSPLREISAQQSILQSSIWSKIFKTPITQRYATQTITLEAFTPHEIKRMLQTVLHTDIVPPEVISLVETLSGGSSFWVLELLQFISEHGEEQFKLALGYEDSKSSFGSHATGCTSSHTSSVTFSDEPILQKVSALMGTSSKLEPPFSTARRSSNALVKVRLDKLVLCRFGNLSPDHQLVLRTASVIGASFSVRVLSYILSEHLRDGLDDSIDILVNDSWISCDPNIDYVYQFEHDTIHRIVYELTPSSERVVIHSQVAAYLEESVMRDRAYLSLLCHHYQQCDATKALRCAELAADDMLRVSSVFGFVEYVELLLACSMCCKSSPELVEALQRLFLRTREKIRAYDLDAELHRLKTSVKVQHWWNFMFCCATDSAVVVPAHVNKTNHPVLYELSPSSIGTALRQDEAGQGEGVRRSLAIDKSSAAEYGERVLEEGEDEWAWIDDPDCYRRHCENTQRALLTQLDNVILELQLPSAAV